MNQIRILLHTLRFHQWIKNVLCLAGVFFSRHVFDTNVLMKGVLCFGAFSFASSAVYIFNDWQDRLRDQLHPKKSKRPIASGLVSKRYATGLALVCLALGLSAGAFLGKAVLLILAIYLIQNVLYSMYLKHVAILDVIIVSLGFVWRALAGVAAANVPLSSWLVLCTFLLSLFIALAKRRNELTASVGDSSKHREVLNYYSEPFLDQVLSITSACAIIAYALYCLDQATVAKFNHHLLLTVPFVIFGVFRYLMLTQKGHGGDPIETFLTDRSLIITSLLWTSILIYLIYII